MRGVEVMPSAEVIIPPEIELEVSRLE